MSAEPEILCKCGNHHVLCECGKPTLFGIGVVPWCGKESCISRQDSKHSQQRPPQLVQPVVIKEVKLYPCYQCKKVPSSYNYFGFDDNNGYWPPECEDCAFPSRKAAEKL